MTAVRYAVCATEGGKPLTLGVYPSREAAQSALAALRWPVGSDCAAWIAELAAEAEGWWRWYASAN